MMMKETGPLFYILHMKEELHEHVYPAIPNTILWIDDKP